jgi:hypothetical protein
MTIMVSVQDAAVVGFLAANYAPVGYRVQLMVGFPASAALVDAAVATVVAAGLDPARRVARMHPRPGEDALRTDDLLEFLRKYGHEYCVGVLVEQPSLDAEAITAAAAAVGFPVLWVAAD